MRWLPFALLAVTVAILVVGGRLIRSQRAKGAVWVLLVVNAVLLGSVAYCVAAVTRFERNNVDVFLLIGTGIVAVVTMFLPLASPEKWVTTRDKNTHMERSVPPKSVERQIGVFLALLFVCCVAGVVRGCSRQDRPEPEHWHDELAHAQRVWATTEKLPAPTPTETWDPKTNGVYVTYPVFPNWRDARFLVVNVGDRIRRRSGSIVQKLQGIEIDPLQFDLPVCRQAAPKGDASHIVFVKWSHNNEGRYTNGAEAGSWSVTARFVDYHSSAVMLEMSFTGHAPSTISNVGYSQEPMSVEHVEEMLGAFLVNGAACTE